MSLINLVVTLVVVGVLLWAINTYVPMDRRIKQILNVAVVIVVILWLLRGFGASGLLGGVGDIGFSG
jgi:ABC-type long-subunit fatty acid transport system fused permease/ATPase subunit